MREQREFGKDEVKLRNGKPVKEEILWLVAMPGTTAVTGKDDDHSPIEPLDVVRFAVSGYRWGQVIDARKALPRRTGSRPANRPRATSTGSGSSAGPPRPRTRRGREGGLHRRRRPDRAPLAGGQGQLRPRPVPPWWQHEPGEGRRDHDPPPRPGRQGVRAARADEVFLDAPWKKVAVGVGGVSAANDPADDEPFLDVVQGYRSFRNMAVSEPWL